MEALAGYLLYRLIILNPIVSFRSKEFLKDKAQTHTVLCLSGFVDVLTFFFIHHLLPCSTALAYLHLLPPGTPPTIDLEEFLMVVLARRMGMVKRGAELDRSSRAAVYFVRWWREEGGLLSAISSISNMDISLGVDFVANALLVPEFSLLAK